MVEHTAQLDAIFQALAHPARRLILQQLRTGEKCLSDLAEPLKMTFQAVSKHIRVLEGANLIARRVSGRTHLCSLRATPFTQVMDYTEQFRELWEHRFDALDEFLQESKTMGNTRDAE